MRRGREGEGAALFKHDPPFAFVLPRRALPVPTRKCCTKSPDWAGTNESFRIRFLQRSSATIAATISIEPRLSETGMSQRYVLRTQYSKENLRKVSSKLRHVRRLPELRVRRQPTLPASHPAEAVIGLPDHRSQRSNNNLASASGSSSTSQRVKMPVSSHISRFASYTLPASTCPSPPNLLLTSPSVSYR